jgi:DNA-binding response OmpR family regulator
MRRIGERAFLRYNVRMKGTILIAEDDAVLRNLYVKKFSVAGYDIRAVEDGEAALAALQERLPDIAILDIHMPKLDGFQVLEKFPPSQRSFPAIMLTNFADERSKQRGKELGADDYFVKKDMTIRSLLEMVEKVLANWKMSHPS